MNRVLSLIFIVLVAMSCSEGGFKKADGGLEYKFIVKNAHHLQPTYNDIINVSMYYTTEKDSVLYDTRETGTVFRLKLKQTSDKKGTIDDGLLLMHEGDSAIFKVDAVRFFTETRGEDVPPYIKPGDKLIFYVKFFDIFNMKKYLEEKHRHINASEKEEMEQLNEYLSTSNISAKPTATGLYYIETQKGNGNMPDSTSSVSIHYIVSFISGEIIDNTYERNQPFDFQLGKNSVIPGLEEGVRYMHEGGEATLIIPSKLAYGNQQYKKVPPFSTLVFEVKLINVK